MNILKSNFLLIIFSITFFTGCSSFRGLPSHGGGKRFDEEQRVVAGAIRRATGRMNLSDLKGFKVKVKLISIPTSGAGNISWGGLQGLSLGLDYSDSLSEYLKSNYKYPVTPTEGIAKDYKTQTRAIKNGGRVGINYKPHSGFSSQRMMTDGDVKYLESAFLMNAHHNGINLVSKGQDVNLFILVDVLGTNRSRNDYLIWLEEELSASCEISYYAIHKNGELAFRCRRTSAVAHYAETRIFGIGNEYVTRSIQNISLGQFEETPDNSSNKTGGFFDEYENVSTSIFKQKFTDEEDEYLQVLSDRAKYEIEIGNIIDARLDLDRIEVIDSSYKDLKELYDLLNKANESNKFDLLENNSSNENSSLDAEEDDSENENENESESLGE